MEKVVVVVVVAVLGCLGVDCFFCWLVFRH